MIQEIFKNNYVKKVFGTAGSGKTTYLINECETLFKNGVNPERIAFVSFTNKSVNEMTSRMLEKFKQFEKNQFENFRTIHSMAFRSSAVKNILKIKDLVKIASIIGVEISKNYSIEDGAGTKKGDKIMTIEQLSRLRMVSLEDQWRSCNFEDVPLFLVKQWQYQLKKYKKENNLIDFTDMLEIYCGRAIDVDYFFIDEAQDLSPLQWKVLNDMAQSSKKIIMAGDDDQAIYNWAGADVNYILKIKSEEEVVLKQTHRMPKNIYKLSRIILSKINNRKNKEYTPEKQDGEILRLSHIDSLKINKNEEYLFLSRNRNQLKNIIKKIEDLGLPYKLISRNSTDCDEVDAIKIWERFRKNNEISFSDYENVCVFSRKLKKYKREDLPESLKIEWYNIFDLMDHTKITYFRKLLQNGFKFNDEPKIILSTIHQSKGGESDNVIIITDVSYNTWKNINKDDEHRVWYVAVSRSKKNLTIIQEQTNLYYKL